MKSTTRTRSRTSLLDLPPEIRHRIYELYFEDVQVAIRPASIVIESSRARKMQPRLQTNPSGTLHPRLALFQVCRQVFRESEPFFYRQANFHIDIMSKTTTTAVPVEKLYRMKYFSGGAEVRQLLELDEYRSTRRKKYSIMGPFEPHRIRADGLDIKKSMSHPVMGFVVDEANAEAHLSVSFSTYLPGLSACVF